MQLGLFQQPWRQDASGKGLTLGFPTQKCVMSSWWGYRSNNLVGGYKDPKYVFFTTLASLSGGFSMKTQKNREAISRESFTAAISGLRKILQILQLLEVFSPFRQIIYKTPHTNYISLHSANGP